MAKLTRSEKETVVVFNEADEDAEISTYNRRWINRLNELVELDVAEELEDEAEETGSHTYVIPKRLLFPRKPRKQREWTDEQRAEVGARFAAAREEVEEEEEAPKPRRRTKARAKPKAKPKATARAPAKKRPTKRRAVVVEEEDDDTEDFEDEEETVVQKPARRRRRGAAS